MAQILIIDDDPKVRLMLRTLFESQGYAVVEAANGKDGIRCYREARADLVITDLVMPEKEGIETILELKREFPGIQIIAMSGGGKFQHKGYLDMAAQLGAVDTFEKPIPRQTLLTTVRALIG